MSRQVGFAVLVLFLAALLGFTGCKKQVAPSPVASAPPATAPAPTANIAASPTSITSGESTVLTWHSTNASSATIEGIGDVPTSGVKTVTPASSTSYRLVAHGAGGTADASVEITVNAPPPVAQPANTISSEEDFEEHVKDVFFDYDKYNLRSDAQTTLARDASYLDTHPNLDFVIGGYCDERGSEAYNLALGQNRAEATKDALVNAGVAASRIRVVSYGKERPFCTQATDSCWQLNRRGGFAMNR